MRELYIRQKEAGPLRVPSRVPLLEGGEEVTVYSCSDVRDYRNGLLWTSHTIKYDHK